MILVQREHGLDARTAATRATTLAHLQHMHALFEFETREQLRAWLDDLIGELQRQHGVLGLSRVLLFFHSPGVLADVRERMAFGGLLNAFTAPRCWAEFGARMSRLEELAARFESPAGRH